MSQKNGFSFAFEASSSLAALLPGLTAIGGSFESLFGSGGGPDTGLRGFGGGGGPGGGGPGVLGGGGGGGDAAGGFGGGGGGAAGGFGEAWPPALEIGLKEAGGSGGKGCALPGGGFKEGLPGKATLALPGGGFSPRDTLLLVDMFEALIKAALAITLLADSVDNVALEDIPPAALSKLLVNE